MPMLQILRISTAPECKKESTTYDGRSSEHSIIGQVTCDVDLEGVALYE